MVVNILVGIIPVMIAAVVIVAVAVILVVVFNDVVVYDVRRSLPTDIISLRRMSRRTNKAGCRSFVGK